MLKLLKYLFSFLLSIPLIPLSAQIQNTDNLFHYEMGKSSIDTEDEKLSGVVILTPSNTAER